RSRVKQRKEARREKEDTRRKSDATGPQNTREKRKHEDSNNDADTNLGQKVAKTVSSHRDSSKKTKSGVFISSLFRKNPEIPTISNTEVDAVQENVFTGDTFRELPLHPYLISNLEEKQGFKQLTEVQKQTIPLLLKGKDALVKSQTGSGKTLAYAVPVVHSLQSRKLKVQRSDGPYALIIVPTRELALQSYDLFQKLLRSFVWIVSGCLMGGEKRKAEKSRLRKGVNVLVATPGRLMDHINTTGVLSLARVRWLVIDEADRLLELGYEKDVAQILNALKAQCPDPPQTVLLSATLSQGVERLSSLTLSNPEHVNVSDHCFTETPTSPTGLTTTATVESFSLPTQLKQHFVVTPCKLRLVLLAGLILWKCKYSKPRSKMIVFLSTQDSVEFHARLFAQVLGCKRSIQKKLSDLASGAKHDVGDSDDEVEDEIGEDQDSDSDVENGTVTETGKTIEQGLQIFKLHGDMNQKDRSKTFQDFTATTSGVLLCTDVAARGLDLPLVDWIVQYTSPGATTDYIHRVGRTARAGSLGHSLLFLMPSEVGYVEELNKYKISITQFDYSAILKCLLQNISGLPKPTSNISGLQTPRTQEEAATYLQDRFEECIIDRKPMHGLAAKGFQSYIRAYATYSKEVKDIFKVSDLHLGHVAKSFALREAPAQIQGVKAKFSGLSTSGGANKYKKKKEDLPSKRPLSFKQATLSEYSSGFQQKQVKKIMAKPGGKMKAKVKVKQQTNKKRFVKKNSTK
ncbi:RNA helicase, partial [Elysia marginata]